MRSRGFRLSSESELTTELISEPAATTLAPAKRSGDCDAERTFLRLLGCSGEANGMRLRPLSRAGFLYGVDCCDLALLALPFLMGCEMSGCSDLLLLGVCPERSRCFLYLLSWRCRCR